jgi:CO/xanthine dehydrogenase Mo-binding subunit
MPDLRRDVGIALDQVSFRDWDTDSVPDSGPTVASRGTFVGGNAVKQACEQLLKVLYNVAGDLLGVSPGDLIAKEGGIAFARNPELRISFKEVVSACQKKGKELKAIGWYKSPSTGTDSETGQGVPFFDYVYGADVAEVEVDSETGSVQLLNYISVHDVGRAINPDLVAGQIYGGVCMGLGTALYEEYSLKNKIPGTFNLNDCLVPTAMDMGKVIPIILEKQFIHGPFGASSIGEPASQIVAPAILNAIAHATGRRIYDLPADLERILLGRPLRKRI